LLLWKYTKGISTERKRMPISFGHEISKRKANWIGHILRRNCLLRRVIEGNIKVGDRSDRKTRKKT
jgi:hypothetical protein